MSATKPRRVCLVVNTKSRRGARRFTPIVERLGRTPGLELVEAVAVDQPGRLDAEVRRLLRRRPDVLAVGSGDGTVSHIVDLMVGRTTALAIIPLGTTNNYARTLGVPLDVASAIAVIADGPTRAVDLARIGHDYFANVASFGLSTSIARAVSPRAKRYVGRLAYGLAALQEFVLHRSFACEVEADGTLHRFTTHQLIVANGRYHGGSLISDRARVANGKLIIFRLDSGSRLDLITNFIRFNLRGIEAMKNLTAIEATRAVITTTPRRRLEIDGELAARTPVTVESVPGAITVIGPAGSPQAR